MKRKIQRNANPNDFYPNCGCESEQECERCPHCGMCAITVDYCACWPRLSGVDESLNYDAHRETLGG